MILILFNGFIPMITSTIRRCEKEVFNYFDAPETNAFVEGLNSVIRRNCYTGARL